MLLCKGQNHGHLWRKARIAKRIHSQFCFPSLPFLSHISGTILLSAIETSVLAESTQNQVEIKNVLEAQAKRIWMILGLKILYLLQGVFHLKFFGELFMFIWSSEEHF